VFVNRDCLDQGLVELAGGDWSYASRLLAFAWGTYPSVVLRQPKAWALLGLLLGGPLGTVAARSMHARYKRSRGLPTLESVRASGDPGRIGHARKGPTPLNQTVETSMEKV
jgi:hypothetical protein